MEDKIKQIIKNMNKFVFFIIIAIILVIGCFNTSYSVKEQEQALVLTLGKPTSVQGPGLHFKIPFIQSVKIVNTTIQGLPIGYDIKTICQLKRSLL